MQINTKSKKTQDTWEQINNLPKPSYYLNILVMQVFAISTMYLSLFVTYV